MLAIARVVAAHGLRGEVKAEVLTDFPQRFRATRQVWIGEPPREFVVHGARVVGNQVFLKLARIETREAAERLTGQLVQVPESQAVTLEAGQYFWHQLIGLEVRRLDGEALGCVSQILRTGSNDVYVVNGTRGEWLLPATREVIRQIALDQGEIRVDLLPGMGPEA